MRLARGLPLLSGIIPVFLGCSCKVVSGVVQIASVEIPADGHLCPKLPPALIPCLLGHTSVSAACFCNPNSPLPSE